MIVPADINQDDIVKVLVNEDGVEDQMYGIVGMNTGKTLGLRYLNATELVYKNACVYEVESTELSPAPYATFCDVAKTDWINSKIQDDEWTQGAGEAAQNCKVAADLQWRIK